jgi:arginine repressor
MLKDEVAGDPTTEQRWIRSSLRRLSRRLADEGHQASHDTVARLLNKMGFSLKANKRKQGRFGCPEGRTVQVHRFPEATIYHGSFAHQQYRYKEE